ncbi:hypothetical protein [Neisseria iguanae]|uniref:hypothetical protein n=1 Tax=Neisseria iguanae TaxID=90242 RepID=UPI0026829071
MDYCQKAMDLFDDDKEYLNIKSRCFRYEICRFELVAKELEKRFNTVLENDPDGKFKEINDIFFNEMRNRDVLLSRFKIYVSKLLSALDYREERQEELTARKNIGSIITTNYDNFAQDVFDFNPLNRK